jgi:predicted nuclease with RNAse H fold
MKRPFRTFLGVDLGGGKGKNTAVARLGLAEDGSLEVLEVGTQTATKEPWYDETLVAYLATHAKDAVIAMDAPLTLPVCVRCVEPVCPGMTVCEDPTIVWFRTVGEQLFAESAVAERDRIAAVPAGRTRSAPPPREKPRITPYTQRASEVVLHRRHGILPRETLGQGMGPLTARAAHLVRALRRHDFREHHNLIEVYPKATIHRLWGDKIARRYKREVDTWQTRARVLESLRGQVEFARASGFARESVLQNDHCFDAVICAYTAFLWARDEWKPPADPVFRADGWIYAPGVD